MKDLLRLGVALVLLLTLCFAQPLGVQAATSDTVTVNGTPGYITITNAPDYWDVNGIVGVGVISVNTVYYSNPLGDTDSPSDPVSDTECYFTITNGSTVATNITVDFSDFAGGMTMTNSGTGNNGATEFGAYSYNENDVTYATNKTICQTSGSDYMHSNLAAATDLDWGLELETRTDAWTNATVMQATVTITATQAY